MIAEAIRDKLIDTLAVTSELATYDFGGDVLGPAVFTIEPIPHDCELPAIVVTEAGGDRFGTRAKRGAEMDADVNIWGDKSRSQKLLRDLAEVVWTTLDRAHLTVTGYSEVGCYAYPPQKLTDPDGFPGYLIRIMVRILEE